MRDYIDTNYLILVSSDGKKTGLEILRDRINKNRWPIYDKTPQLLNVEACMMISKLSSNKMGLEKIAKLLSKN